MKMFKKAAIFALILALFAVIAAGCAKNPADDTDSGEPEVYDNLSEGDSAPISLPRLSAAGNSSSPISRIRW